ncbi:MAG TPA: ribbon-helix-helix domain-containing protein [Rhizomicrobium sp.]|nr:ribbon-helix-helix domain-containing protein [Rhizomicrobium sp.]
MSAASPERRARFLRKRSFSIAGHRTSVALEPEFWIVLEKEARRGGRTLSALVSQVDAAREARPLASALRLAALSAASRGHVGQLPPR